MSKVLKHTNTFMEGVHALALLYDLVENDAMPTPEEAEVVRILYSAS